MHEWWYRYLLHSQPNYSQINHSKQANLIPIDINVSRCWNPITQVSLTPELSRPKPLTRRRVKAPRKGITTAVIRAAMLVYPCLNDTVIIKGGECEDAMLLEVNWNGNASPTPYRCSVGIRSNCFYNATVRDLIERRHCWHVSKFRRH